MARPIFRLSDVMMLCLTLIVCGCNDPSTLTGVEMTIPYQIIVQGNQKKADSIARAVFEEVDATYNNWNPNSEVSAFNQLEVGTKFELSNELASLLQKIDGIVKQTDGLFDPTIGHWNELCVEGKIACKEAPLTLDLGGVAKGHCVDLLVEQLVAGGFRNCYVCWGGEIRTVGHHPSGRPWRVALQSPLPGEPPMGTFDLTDQSVATSGDYLQMEVIDGELYTHIRDPRTAQPLKIETGSVASATVWAPTCLEADALATAAMVSGQKPSEVEALILYR